VIRQDAPHSTEYCTQTSTYQLATIALQRSNHWQHAKVVVIIVFLNVAQPARAVASQQHCHGGWHASRVPLVKCSSPVESGLSIKHGVYESGPGGRPTDKSMCLWSAMCMGTSLSSRAMCAKTEMRQATKISPNGVRPVRACTSTLPTKTDQRIPNIWCWHWQSCINMWNSKSGAQVQGYTYYHRGFLG